MSQPMNREQRRMLKKQGQQVNEAGEIVADEKTAAKQAKSRSTKTDSSGGSGSGGRVTAKAGDSGDGGRPSRKAPERTTEERTKPLQFAREVRTEVRKVSWPSRAEVINYSLVVFFTVVVLTAFIGVLDWGFSVSILELFRP